MAFPNGEVDIIRVRIWMTEPEILDYFSYNVHIAAMARENCEYRDSVKGRQWLIVVAVY